MKNSRSESYAKAGVDITAGYKAAAEAANIVKTTLVTSACDVRLHKLNRLITGGDINTCRLVTFTVTL